MRMIEKDLGIEENGDDRKVSDIVRRSLVSL